MPFAQMLSEEVGRRTDTEKDKVPVIGVSKEWQDSQGDFRHAVPLEKSLASRLIDLVPFVAMMLIPLAFLILAGLMWSLHREPTSSKGEKVLQVMGVASTLWPIAFAAVLGPLLKTVALYNAERGVKLRVLEMLSNSHTLVSTIRACVTFQFFSLWTAVLLIIWALSPAGGQAVLRSVTIEQAAQNTSYPLVYFPATTDGIPFYEDLWNSASTLASNAAMIKTLLGAVITAPNSAALLANGSSLNFEDGLDRLGGAAKVISASKQDIWGNVRVPYLELLPGYKIHTPFDWVEVPTDQVVAYESLVGIPVRGTPLGDVGNITFPLSAVYTTLKCSKWLNTTAFVEENYQQNVSYLAGSGGLVGSSSASSNIFLGKYENATSSMYFGTYDNMTICAINETHVDAEIECVRALADREMSCSPRRVRHTKGFPISMAEDKWFGSGSDGRPASNLLSNIPWLLPSDHPVNPSPLEAYLLDPLYGGIATTRNITDQYSKLSAETFDARLAVILNTVLRISFGYSTILGTDGTDFTNKTGQLVDGGLMQFGNVTGVWSAYTSPVYRLHKGWLALYIISIGVLVLCVITAVVLRAMIHAPDFLNNVSGFARDSPYISHPPGGSVLDGKELAKSIGEKRVKIGDVRPDDDVGRIALADETEVTQGLLKPGRRYI